MVYLRARYYAPKTGRFINKDVWPGDAKRPMSYNAWLYGYGNPVNFIDLSGNSPESMGTGNEVIRYIIQRIRIDSNSESIKEIYELNNTHYFKDACDLFSHSLMLRLLRGNDYLREALYADMGAKANASAEFGCLVADAKSRPLCGQWDYKLEIGQQWGQAQTIDFSPNGIEETLIVYYDIWANFHFGYLGMVGGFTEEQLLSGAALEHAASNLDLPIQDDPSDRIAMQVGMDIFKSNSLSESNLLTWIYIVKSELNKAIVENGKVIGVYR